MRQQNLAERQFGAAARAYLGSSAHATGADLKRLEGLARAMDHPLALDLGCGAGHASYALAKGGAEVTACDLSDKMLDVVREEAELRGLDITARKCAAGRLPFASAGFDLVTTRYSAHHWPDVPAALAEMRRVLKPGGSLVIIDVVAPEEPLADSVLQTVELLRDASHVRDYRVSEWQGMLLCADFAPPAVDRWTIEQDFAGYVERIRTPELRAKAAREVLESAPEEAKKRLGVRFSGADCTFSLDVAWLRTAIPA